MTNILWVKLPLLPVYPLSCFVGESGIHPYAPDVVGKSGIFSPTPPDVTGNRAFFTPTPPDVTGSRAFFYPYPS